MTKTKLNVEEWLNAVVAGRFAAVRAGLEAGIDPNALHDGETALAKAIEAGNVKVVQTLIDLGANVNLADRYGMTALHYAALRSKKVELLKALVDAGADPRRKSTKKHGLWAGGVKGGTPLEMARARRLPEKRVIAFLESLG